VIIRQFQKTTNGGQNWNTQITPAMTWCWDIYFSDANRGWAVGYGSTFNILTSTNGGGPVFISNLNTDVPFNNPLVSELSESV